MTDVKIAQARQGIGKDVRLEALADAYAITENTPGQKADRCCEAFLKTIESGYWRPGDLVPTEKEIAAVLPVSLGTVQIALRRLAADGIIQRTRGLGTRITTPRDPRQDPKHLRFLADDGKTLLPHEIRLIAIEETDEQGIWADYLGARASFIRIIRHIEVGQEFTIYSAFYLDGQRFRPLLDIVPETFKQLHLRLILQDRFNSPTLGFTQNIAFVTPPPPISKIIGIAPGDQALMHEVMAYSLRDKPLSYHQIIIPPTNRKLNISDSI